MKKFKQIICLLGAAFLAGMYILTLIFSITDNSQAKSWLLASLYCTFAVPFFLYAVLLITKQLQGRGYRETETASVLDPGSENEAAPDSAPSIDTKSEAESETESETKSET